MIEPTYPTDAHDKLKEEIDLAVLQLSRVGAAHRCTVHTALSTTPPLFDAVSGTEGSCLSRSPSTAVTLDGSSQRSADTRSSTSHRSARSGSTSSTVSVQSLRGRKLAQLARLQTQIAGLAERNAGHLRDGKYTNTQKKPSRKPAPERHSQPAQSPTHQNGLQNPHKDDPTQEHRTSHTPEPSKSVYTTPYSRVQPPREGKEINQRCVSSMSHSEGRRFGRVGEIVSNTEVEGVQSKESCHQTRCVSTTSCNSAEGRRIASRVAVSADRLHRGVSTQPNTMRAQPHTTHTQASLWAEVLCTALSVSLFGKAVDTILQRQYQPNASAGVHSFLSHPTPLSVAKHSVNVVRTQHIGVIAGFLQAVQKNTAFGVKNALRRHLMLCARVRNTVRRFLNVRQARKKLWTLQIRRAAKHYVIPQEAQNETQFAEYRSVVRASQRTDKRALAHNTLLLQKVVSVPTLSDAQVDNIVEGAYLRHKRMYLAQLALHEVQQTQGDVAVGRKAPQFPVLLAPEVVARLVSTALEGEQGRFEARIQASLLEGAVAEAVRVERRMR